jgi:hypothetical protein
MNCFHISAGSQPALFIRSIIFRIILDIISGSAFVATAITIPPPMAPRTVAIIKLLVSKRLLLICVTPVFYYDEFKLQDKQLCKKVLLFSIAS